MNKTEVKINGITFPVYSVNTLIIGSGAASLNTAVFLFERGIKDVVIATDCWGGGTSNNTGSDKQTYYKLSLSGDLPDSALMMAQDLFNGGCMHGDIALCEAQNSLQAFFHLISLGVPFPHDRFGAYVGYKTDHDPRQRATSTGPLTSHLMFEYLAKDVKNKNITVLNNHQIITLLTEKNGDEKHIIGAIAIDKENTNNDNLGFVIFNTVNVVLGTGGPAGIYKTSVYPESQLGSSGIAFEIGAIGNNLTESQYGLASIKFRWNLSGTYQQVIPKYISTKQDGSDEKEFLNDYFPSMGKLATAIFLKGYQWPFDPRKVYNYGSSLIDILVYQETTIKRRRVFLDFTRNPSGAGKLEDFSFDLLEKEAYEYLKKSGVLFGIPIERLKKMNQPAIDLYKNHGIDITKERLEIAVCAQHNNGGLKGNIWWESNIKHLFPVGEVNGTHGVYRPGGSALNSGQVAGIRASLFISKKYDFNPPKVDDFINSAEFQIKNKFNFAKSIIDIKFKDKDLISNSMKEFQERISSCAAHIRDYDKVIKAVEEAWNQYKYLKSEIKINSSEKLPQAFRILDLCLTHTIYLEAIKEYLEKGGKSRGSYLVLDSEGEKPCKELSDDWKFSLNKSDLSVNQKILEIHLNDNQDIKKIWVDIKPIPAEDIWFENVWNEYLKNNIVK
jgi:succinate dehydrogenase/fumarate reductase flavoprotein subunit